MRKSLILLVFLLGCNDGGNGGNDAGTDWACPPETYQACHDGQYVRTTTLPNCTASEERGYCRCMRCADDVTCDDTCWR